MMKFLFIADPLKGFSVKKETTLAMMDVAHQAGHQVWHCHIEDLKSIQGLIKSNCQNLSIQRGESTWYEVLSSELHELTHFDFIIMRKDPPFDMSYVTATWFLSEAVRQGASVFNAPEALRNHSEKLALLEFMEFAPPTIISHSLTDMKAFHQQHQDIIIKPLDGMGGRGIFRVKADGLNIASIVETLGNHGERALMVQKFISEITDGDKRVLLIGGEPVPFSLARIPQVGEVRGNLAAGGKGVAQKLTLKEFEIASKLGPILAKRGLHLVGLDFIGGYLTEINVTSPTCFVEITEQTGHDVAKQWLQNLENTLK
jgi:glutathione synthase